MSSCKVLWWVCLCVCLSVYLSVKISLEPHVQSLPIFLYTLPMSMARSSGVVVIRYVQRSYRNSFWYCSGPEQRRFGPVSEHFLFRCRNMLSIFSLLSETVATVSLSAPPTVAHIRRWAVNTMPAVGQTMQFGDNYLNNGHFPPEMPQIDGRDSFTSVSQLSLAVSFKVHDATGTT